MLTVPKSEAETLNILKLWPDSQGNGRFATDSQGHIRMSDGDLRAETFPQTWANTGDTACRVKGVYGMSELEFLFITRLS